MCAAVVAHDMQKRYFVALHLASNQLDHQATRKPATLKVRMRADAADFAQRAGSHTLAGHGHQTLTFEAAKVLAKLDGSRTERSWTGQRGQLERLRRVLRAEWDSFWRVVGGGDVSLPKHLEHRGLRVDVPAARN